MSFILPIIGGAMGVLIVACLLYCIDENKEINKQ